MRKLRSKILILLFAACLMLICSLPALAATDSEISAAADKAANYLIKNVPAPTFGSTGGEWVVFGLSRGDASLPAGYISGWYADLEQALEKADGVLHARKYSEYSRVVLALHAAGYNPSAVAGYNLLQPLRDFSATTYSGLASAAYAMLALDSGSYGEAGLMEQYLDYILSRQLADGGWDLSNNAADTDITAICLQALAKYASQPQVKTAIDKGLSCLSALQYSDGSFDSLEVVNCESSAQVIVALCELGIDITDSRFVKNGKTVADALLTFQQSSGGFIHRAGEKIDLMATEQAYYALVALHRYQTGQSSLYDMADNTTSLFSDINGHVHRQAIEALAKRGIINGMGDGSFAPDATMTRAQYAAIISRALGLTESPLSIFSDVPAGSWYQGYIGAAYQSGIITGKSATIFDPEGQITHEHAALMTSRAAELLDSNWRLQKSEQTPISRAEIAAMLYDMLSAAAVI